MAHSKDSLFLPSRILTRGNFSLPGFLAVLLACSYSSADITYTDSTIPGADITTGSGGVGDVTFNITDAGTYSNVMSGSGSVTKTGDGTLTLTTKRSTYSGGTTISKGKVIATPSQNNTGGISTFGTGPILVETGATLEFQVSNQLGTGNSPNDITIKGTLIPSNYTHVKNITLENGVIEKEYGYTDSGSGLDFGDRTATIKSSGNSTIKSRLDFRKNSKVTINVTSGTLTVDGVIHDLKDGNTDGSGGFTKSGSGTLELTVDNTYTGTTTISGGTIKLTGSGDLGSGSVTNNGKIEFASTSPLSISNVISGSGSVLKSGTGDLTISAGNDGQKYTGGTTVSAGTLYLSGTNKGKSSVGTGDVVINNGGTIVANNANVFGYGAASNIPKVIINQGGKLTPPGNLHMYLVEINNGTINANNGGNGLDFSNRNGSITSTGDNSSIAAAIIHKSTLTFDVQSGVLTLSNTVHNQAASTAGTKTIKTGTGTLTTNNWIDGLVEIKAGTLEITKSFNENSKRFNGTVNIEQNAKLECNATDSLGFGTVNTVLNIYGVMDQTVANSYDTLAHTQIYLYGGTIQSTGNSTLDVYNSDVTFNSKALQNATAEKPTVSTISSAVRIRVDDTFQITTDANSQLNITNVISNNGSEGVSCLTEKLGDGTLELTANNTYAGGTKISAGKVILFNDGTLGTGAVENNANLEFAYTTEKLFSNAISGTGSVTKSGDEKLTLSGANAYKGGTTVSAGVLELTDDAVVANGSVTVGANGTLEYNLSNGKKQLLTIYYDSEASNNKISSAGRVVKTGDGTLQICTAAAGLVNADSFVVSSGRLDMKEYFTGTLTVEAGATLSPGNSIGKLTVDGEFSLDSGATLLMEVGKNDQGEIAVDQLILSEVNEETFASGSIINIVLDPDSGLQGGDSFTDLVFITTSSEADAERIYNAVKNATFSYYFPGFEVKQVGNKIVLSGSLDANAIPEPSTWALLALGAAGLLYVRKRKN